MRHCDCGGTPENCYIYAQRAGATKRLNQLLAETSVAMVAWHRPEHHFHSLPESLKAARQKARNNAAKPRIDTTQLIPHHARLFTPQVSLWLREHPDVSCVAHFAFLEIMTVMMV